MALDLTENDLLDREVLGYKLMTLAEIVIRKHFYASYHEKDDLVSVGVLKALSLIEKGQWRKGKGAFYNYIYAGMRNDMHNYLYHQNKETLIDESSVEYQSMSVQDHYFADEVYNLDYSIVREVCEDFEKVFGKGIESKVIEKLEDLGLIIIEKPNTVSQEDINMLKDKYGDTIEEDIISRLIGLIMWKRKEYL